MKVYIEVLRPSGRWADVRRGAVGRLYYPSIASATPGAYRRAIESERAARIMAEGEPPVEQRRWRVCQGYAVPVPPEDWAADDLLVELQQALAPRLVQLLTASRVPARRRALARAALDLLQEASNTFFPLCL